MESSFSSNRGGSFTFTSDPRALLTLQKISTTLPTFLNDSLISSSADASVRLYGSDWVGVVTNGNLFLWRFTQEKDSRVTTASFCRQFELPGADALASAVAVGNFETSGGGTRPQIVAAVVAGTLRLWPRGLLGAGARSQVVQDFIDTRLSGFRGGESAVALEMGPCPSTFLLATSHGRIFGVDARNPQDRVYTFLITDGSNAGGGGGGVDASFRGEGGDRNLDTSLLSGLSRRVSSIWSFATSRVSTLNATLIGTSNNVKVLRFLTEATSPTGCRAILLTASHLTAWDVDSEFESSHLYSLDLAAGGYGDALDLAPVPQDSSPAGLWLLCFDGNSGELNLLTIEAETGEVGASVPAAVEGEVATSGDLQVVTSLAVAQLYPCTLLGIFSKQIGVFCVIEAMTGRCLSQVDFDQPSSPLLGAISASASTGTLFTLLTRYRGIYALVGDDPCLPSLRAPSTSDNVADEITLQSELTRIAAVLWMGFEANAALQLDHLPPSSSREATAALLGLARAILNSRPHSPSSAAAFDFARVNSEGLSRFEAKQRGMQCLGGRFWRPLMASREVVVDSVAVLQHLFPPLLTEEKAMVAGGGHHLLNAFLAGAEVCEAARVVHTKWGRHRRSNVLRGVVERTMQVAATAGLVGGGEEKAELAAAEELFFQTMSVIPLFTANLCEQIVVQVKICLADSSATAPATASAVDFLVCAAELLTTSLTEALEYREKLLPTLRSVLEAESGSGGAKLDLFCWITGSDIVFNQVLNAFDALTEVVAGSTAVVAGVDAVTVNCTSLRQEIACRAVELATLLLRALHQRLQWSITNNSSSVGDLEKAFERLRNRLITAVASQIGRPEAALDLAIRFVDKELMVAIADGLDRQAPGHQYTHLMTALARCPPSAKLADYALNWHYNHGEKARLQSLLMALEQREKAPLSADAEMAISTTEHHQDKQQKRLGATAAEGGGGVSDAKRAKQTVETSVSRFLQRQEARDFAWLHQLGNRDYDQASKGLLTAALSETANAARRRTLLSLAKLAAIAGDRRAKDQVPLVDKHLEVLKYQELWMASHQRKDEQEEVPLRGVCPASSLARLYVEDVDGALERGELLLTFSRALRLAQLSAEVDEGSAMAEGRGQLLQEIWTAAAKVDASNKPDKEAIDLAEICDKSFLCALIDHCIAAGEDAESLLPPEAEFLAAVDNSTHAAWMRGLVESVYTRALKAHEHHPMEI